VVADFDEAIDEYREALRLYVKGDPEPVIAFFSSRDDVTLAHRWGPPCRGRDDVAKETREAGAKFQLGGPLHFEEVTTRFEEVSRYNTSELGFVVHMERHEGQVTGRDDPVVIDRRVTMVFRLEGDIWKLLHRHADPITKAQRDEVAEFVDHVIPLLRSEVLALQTGDPSPRKSLWSHHDPVSLFGAEASASGWGQIEPLFDRLRRELLRGPILRLRGGQRRCQWRSRLCGRDRKLSRCHSRFGTRHLQTSRHDHLPTRTRSLEGRAPAWRSA
jgi:hypothetical protein